MSTVVSMSVNTYTGARVLTYNNRVLINRKTRVLAELKCTGQVQEMHGSEDACSQNYGQHHIPCQLAAPLHPQPEPDDLADEVEGLSQGQVHCALLKPQHLSYEIISQASLVYRQASCLQIVTLRNLLLISVKASTFMSKGWNIFISMMMVVVLIGLWLDCSTRIMMVYTVDTGILKWMARAKVRMTPTIFSTTGVREETGRLSSHCMSLPEGLLASQISSSKRFRQVHAHLKLDIN